MNNQNRTMASEIIVDMRKHILTLDGRIESLADDIERIRAIFRSVHYAAAEGGITEEEADKAMSGIETMLNVLIDNSAELLQYSNNYIRDEME